MIATSAFQAAKSCTAETNLVRLLSNSHRRPVYSCPFSSKVMEHSYRFSWLLFFPFNIHVWQIIKAQCFTVVVTGMQSGSAKYFYSLRSSCSPIKAMAAQETALPKLDSQSSSAGMLCFLRLVSLSCMLLFRSFWFSLLYLEQKLFLGFKKTNLLEFKWQWATQCSILNLYSYWPPLCFVAQYLNLYIFIFIWRRKCLA